MTRIVQKVTEILPAEPPNFQPKKRLWVDMRKSCLDCGYLETLRRYDFEENEEGHLSWTETKELVPDRIRREILKSGVDRWAAKDFRCYRGVWDATFGEDIHKRTIKGLDEATKKRKCPLFFTWSIDDSPETHRELHRERTAWRRTLLATILGVIFGGIVALAGSVLVNLYFLQ